MLLLLLLLMSCMLSAGVFSSVTLGPTVALLVVDAAEMPADPAAAAAAAGDNKEAARTWVLHTRTTVSRE
jgi:hypothetical protein